jgi:hypothetical protein
MMKDVNNPYFESAEGLWSLQNTGQIASHL